MEPIDADGTSKTNNEQRSILAEPSLEHHLVAETLDLSVGLHLDASMVMPDNSEVLKSKSEGENGDIYIGLDDLLPQSNAKERSSLTTDPSAAVHVAGAEKGQGEQLSIPVDETAPPSTSNLQLDEVAASSEDPLTCQGSVVSDSGSSQMEMDSLSLEANILGVTATSESCSPATDPSAAVHVAGGAEKEQEEQLSIPVDKSAPPSTSFNLQLDEVAAASEEDPLTCQASVVPVSGSCLTELDRNCPSAKLQVYRERRDTSIPDSDVTKSVPCQLEDSDLVHSEMDIVDKVTENRVVNNNIITESTHCYPVHEEHVMEPNVGIPTEEHPEATSQMPEKPAQTEKQEIPATDVPAISEEDRAGTPLRRSRRKSLNANRLADESEEELFDDGESLGKKVQQKSKKTVRKHKETNEASDQAANKNPQKRRLDKAQKPATNQRMDRICIYIAYNGKWTTNNKYLDHDTKLVLVSDEITFEGLVEEIFHVLKLKRGESQANIWFDTKLETSKGMLVTNDEEVTTCIYLLKNDSNFKTSRFIVDLAERNSLSPKSSNTESRVVHDEFNFREMDIERRQGFTVAEPITQLQFLSPKGRTKEMGQTSNVKKVKKRSRNKRNDLPITVLRENASLDEIVVGSMFEDKQNLKKCFANNAIKYNFQFKVKKSSTVKWWLKCYDEECSWCMHSSKVRDSAFFKIKKFQKNHTCFPVEFKSDQRHVTPQLISDHIIELLRNTNVEIKPNFVVEEIKRKYGLSIGYHKAWRSMQRALAIIRGCPEYDYKLLPSNPETEQHDTGEDLSLNERASQDSKENGAWSPLSKRLLPGTDSPSARTVVAVDCNELPPGWKKEVVIRQNDYGIRKDPLYTDPVHGYVFRSKKDVFRYLETGDTSRCAKKPAKRDVASTMKDNSALLLDSAPSDGNCILIEE